MNKEKILDLAEIIERNGNQILEGTLNKKQYSQDKYLHPCGTPACIAGWACWMNNPFDEWHEEVGKEGYKFWKTARRILGLSFYKARVLFDQDPFDGNYFPTAADAAATLRHLAETGKVEWRRA